MSPPPEVESASRLSLTLVRLSFGGSLTPHPNHPFRDAG